MALKENYKDDILDTSQNVKRKYQMETNGDGTVSFTDVTEYTQQGDSFGASDMNAVNSEVNEVVNNLGAKNMLPNNATTQTLCGVTFTVNNDGSITANGTATATMVLELLANDTSLASGDYILSGSPSGGSISTFYLWFRRSDGTGSFVNYEGDTEISYTKTSSPLFVGIVINEGYTANNIVFKPMLRPSSIKDDTYAPYAQTNKELTDNLSDGIGGTNDTFRFGTDGSGNYGYIKKVEGADTFFPFKSGGRWEKITKAINGSSWTDITTDIEGLSLVVIAWGTGDAYNQYITFYEVNGTTMTILQMRGYTSSAYMGCRIDDGKLQAMFMGGLASSGVPNIYCIYDCEKEV